MPHIFSLQDVFVHLLFKVLYFFHCLFIVHLKVFNNFHHFKKSSIYPLKVNQTLREAHWSFQGWRLRHIKLLTGYEICVQRQTIEIKKIWQNFSNFCTLVQSIWVSITLFQFFSIFQSIHYKQLESGDFNINGNIKKIYFYIRNYILGKE